MIKKYCIHNFKNHADTMLEMSAVTLLTGMNGSGKSSVLQSMLLLRDTYVSSHQLSTLYLKGDSFSVGQVKDAVNYNCKADVERLRISIEMDGGLAHDFFYRYDKAENNTLSADMNEFSRADDVFQAIPLFGDGFQYLSAFRNGPQQVYESDTDVVDSRRQMSHKMGRGEMAVYFLSKFGNDALPIDELCYDTRAAHTIRKQTACWLNEISPGVQIQINQNASQYEIRYGLEMKGKRTIFHSAPNTGYGISYVLSIIVAVLSARPGSLILIENPEAHIHPAGQSALMRLIAMAACAGVQFVIETHSDHIVNGGLVARKKGVIRPDALSVYFFDRDDDGNAMPKRLSIGENGMIQNAPKAFFGQMNADLRVLFDLN